MPSPHPNDMTALLPCPFCGKMPETNPAGQNGRGLMIDCITDNCVQPHTSYYDHATAIRIWNSRRATAAEGVDAARNLLSLINADSATFRAMTQDMRVEMVIVLTKLGMTPTTPAQSSIRDAAVLCAAIPAITLDDALLSMSTFPNGCDFRLRKDGDKWFLEYGCYGVHVNLTQGPRRALMKWLDEGGIDREIIGAKPETIHTLLARKPCAACGGFTFKSHPTSGRGEG